MTIIEGKEVLPSLIPLFQQKQPKWVWILLQKSRQKTGSGGYLYTQSCDHYGGVRGVIDEADVKSGKVKSMRQPDFWRKPFPKTSWLECYEPTSQLYVWQLIET